MTYGLNIKTVSDSGTEPVTVAQVKAWSRIDHSADDDLIATIIIPAARRSVEQYLRRYLMDTTARVTFDCFQDVMAIPVGPVTSVASVNYYDPDGVAQVVDPADYFVDTSNEPARLVANVAWPATESGRPGAVDVYFQAGYVVGSPTVDPEAVPADIRAAVLIMAGQLYENREAVALGMTTNEIPFSLMHLLNPHRLEA
jgi:uncharacterized phiE125 gp8 family phage protein